jgi:hypothetical protein
MDTRAVFDFVVSFTNGGSLRGEGFRLDLPRPDTSEKEIGALVNAGRLKLEAFSPTTQVDNSSLLFWEEEQDLERSGPRGDGTDGLKVRQTFSLDQLSFAVPA